MEPSPAPEAAPSSRELTLPSALSSWAASTPSSVLSHAPSLEDGVKFSGGAVAAFLAVRYAGSLRSACVLGLLSGLFAHSLYADVLRKKRRRRGDKRHEEEEEEETESA